MIKLYNCVLQSICNVQAVMVTMLRPDRPICENRPPPHGWRSRHRCACSHIIDIPQEGVKSADPQRQQSGPMLEDQASRKKDMKVIANNPRHPKYFSQFGSIRKGQLAFKADSNPPEARIKVRVSSFEKVCELLIPGTNNLFQFG